MLLITGGNASSSISTVALSSGGSNGSFQIEHQFFERPNKERSPGNMNMNPVHSVNELLDCCIMYYFAVAHKYIIMVSKVVVCLSDVLCGRIYEDCTDFARVHNIPTVFKHFFFRLLICGTTLVFCLIFWSKQKHHTMT